MHYKIKSKKQLNKRWGGKKKHKNSKGEKKEEKIKPTTTKKKKKMQLSTDTIGWACVLHLVHYTAFRQLIQQSKAGCRSRIKTRGQIRAKSRTVLGFKCTLREAPQIKLASKPIRFTSNGAALSSRVTPGSLITWKKAKSWQKAGETKGKKWQDDENQDARGCMLTDDAMRSRKRGGAVDSG